ncbi:hypothetical protein IAT40_003031 [Kwoniella sp. CBS 6097]
MVETSHINIAAALSGYVVPPLLPVNLLRVVPLISSTLSLQWAVDEYQFLSSWMNPSYRPQADALLPAWFKHGVTWTSGAKPWYAAGVFFAFAHMFFGPKALGLLKKIREGEPAGKPTTSLATWLRMHSIRAFVADLPAVICFAIAAIS